MNSNMCVFTSLSSCGFVELKGDLPKSPQFQNKVSESKEFIGNVNVVTFFLYPGE